MKVAFFLTLKKDVVHLQVDSTMRQALERMEHHRYSAVPLLDRDGRYVGTLTEGDLLWKMKHHTPSLTFAETEIYRLAEVPRHVNNQPVHIDAEMEELLSKAVDQNFVPVVDSREVFIGIVRRRDLIQNCLGMVKDQHGQRLTALPKNFHGGRSESLGESFGESLCETMNDSLHVTIAEPGSSQA